ncbi:hypothetical protein CEXT_630941 [Caerostris extrusa]|uniref:Uncharacterized protein n=1 Tax=Caerostris extrusa TaxID=172846 RepID=A0AAV4RWS8_CAEEX|nr:hypothetical protein CEXT_630941 [Caerostris extrusa]
MREAELTLSMMELSMIVKRSENTFAKNAVDVKNESASILWEICFFFHHFNFDGERVAKLLRQKSRLATAWFFIPVLSCRFSAETSDIAFSFTPWTTLSYVGMTYDSKRVDYKPVKLIDAVMI